MLSRRFVPPALMVSALLLAACGSPAPQAAPPSAPAPSSSSSAPPPSSSSAPASSSSAAVPATATGKVVVLDPGHNGGNASHTAEINRLVPAGRGVHKPCNTTGTSTNSGFTEHAFNWDVAQRVAAALSARGVRVIMTRSSDTGVGPCVDQRAEIGNKANAAAVVSIHADGANSAAAHGFHVSYPAPPLNAEQGAPSIALAKAVRGSMSGDGLATSSYLGKDGLYPRADLGGLNLSDRPSILVECGNMRNSAEVASFTSATGREHYATAIAAGILRYLGV